MDQPKPENLFFFKGHQLKNSVMCKQYVKQVACYNELKATSNFLVLKREQFFRAI
jgi:hypothetical protein